MRWPIRFLIFAVSTGLMLAVGVVPFRPGLGSGGEPRRLLMGALETVWWLGAAWVVVGLLRGFLVLGRQPRESQLIKDLLAALIYLSAAFAIVVEVFDLPLRGLLATSGAVAIILGLALQSSLADVFSGIVLNIERPYGVGDWVIVDDTVQGTVIETNWRATHILTGNQDVAIIPNSVVAKAKLVNCSTPTRVHSTSIRVKLDPSITPATGCHLLKEVLLSSGQILQTPEPSVTIMDLSAEMIDYEVSFSVLDISVVPQAQNEIYDRVFRAAAAVGAQLSPRLPGLLRNSSVDSHRLGVPESLLAGISLFSTLTVQEKAALASEMRRRDYKPGQLIVAQGTIMQSLCVVSDGVLVNSTQENGQQREVARLATGDYFGESGLLTGEPLNGQVAALTRAVIYEISKEALSPLLKARPAIAEELSETLTSLQLANRTALDHRSDREPGEGRLTDRVAATIRRLFSLH
jgi:small-conductance mechanosensitive channel/CRP-like cAMP-binding protein